MSRTVIVQGIVLLALSQSIAAVFLRSHSLPDNSSASKNGTGQDATAALSAVMDMVGSMQATLKPHHTASPSNASHQHAKLDVGFTGYEHNLTDALTAVMRNSTTSAQWSDALRQRLIANVTGNISAVLKTQLKAMKQSIGKTWMALPEDEQKDLYVNQLKANFLPVFEDALKTIMNHVGRSGARVEALAKLHTPMAGEELLTKSEQTFLDAVVAERCYGGEELLQLSLVELSEITYVAAPTPTNSSTGNQTHKKLGRFCLPSAVEHLAGRLNDAQGLLSMTMRFEAGAMNMVQTKKKGSK